MVYAQTLDYLLTHLGVIYEEDVLNIALNGRMLFNAIVQKENYSSDYPS